MGEGPVTRSKRRWLRPYVVVISPWTRENYVSHNLTDTASVVRFIEDNWLNGERIPNSYDAVSGSLDAPGGLLDFHTIPHFARVILDPTTGAVVSAGLSGNNPGFPQSVHASKCPRLKVSTL
jgi:phospholipase C